MVNDRTDILNRFAEAVAKGLRDHHHARTMSRIAGTEDIAQLPQYLSDEDDLVRIAAEAKLRLLLHKLKGAYRDGS